MRHMLLALFVFILLAVLFAVMQVGRFIGERKAEASRLSSRELIVRQMLTTCVRPDGKPYANKHEALTDALLYLEGRDIYKAEAIVEEWVSGYDSDEFAELMEPNFYGFGYGYLYRVVHHELAKNE